MGFLQRLLGRQTETSQPTQSSTSVPYERPEWMRDGMQVTVYEGDQTLEVVGESNYQDELHRVVEEGGRDVYAILAPELDNRYDSNAVAVWVFGYKVGFLSRDDAAIYCSGIVKLMQEGGKPVGLAGNIAGGYPDRPMFGIFLQFDPADFGRPRPSGGAASAPGVDTGTVAVSSDWRERVPSDTFQAIKYLRGKLESDAKPVDRHFMYLELETRLYKSRDVFASALGEYTEVAKSHDAEMDTIRSALMDSFDGIPRLPTYKQMAIVEQKKRTSRTSRSASGSTRGSLVGR